VKQRQQQLAYTQVNNPKNCFVLYVSSSRHHGQPHQRSRGSRRLTVMRGFSRRMTYSYLHNDAPPPSHIFNHLWRVRVCALILDFDKNNF